METGFSKFFRYSLRNTEIILRAGQRIISEINILVENSQGSSQIPKSNPQLLNAEIKKKIARHENIKIFMNIIQWNCRGLKNKFIWLNIPPFSEADIWVFQETFLSIHDNINLPNKIIFRKYREDRSGGGLLIAVSSNISAQQIPIQIQQTRELEILAIKIHVRNISYYIVNIYAPRGFNIIIIKSFLESLMAPMIIFGDFNLHHPIWGSDHISRYSNEFVEWITDSNLVLNKTVPTYRSSADATSLIDLTVCSSSISGYCNSYVLDCSFESDHSPIITELSLLNSNKRIFKKVNWQAVMNQTHFILNNPEVNSENLSDKISQVIANNIREIKVSNRSFPPWWNSTCYKFYKLKKYLGKSY
ncbi:hypothetical protein TNCV_2495831 [Trichonephila clavipes]|nr:hypothetical protein TNCV_2495831 [Trichonephila clavipes]